MAGYNQMRSLPVVVHLCEWNFHETIAPMADRYLNHLHRCVGKSLLQLSGMILDSRTQRREGILSSLHYTACEIVGTLLQGSKQNIVLGHELHHGKVLWSHSRLTMHPVSGRRAFRMRIFAAHMSSLVAVKLKRVI